jgi:hypothetical protein
MSSGAPHRAILRIWSPSAGFLLQTPIWQSALDWYVTEQFPDSSYILRRCSRESYVDSEVELVDVGLLRRSGRRLQERASSERSPASFPSGTTRISGNSGRIGNDWTSEAGANLPIGVPFDNPRDWWFERRDEAQPPTI